ncbi:sporulation integral membrane protein YlbJ [Ammoniphilus sp. CFH 90114]|uniref:sporulation integral membrane protein YlbJ n=1 Tax=Ammoniphilus sp. CFH 90114 TaxID=2493665 RepID=UPI00100ED95C|nr:sporulation integral membrane protein YlbJ [Ammoniphilus sp. CFH 90114]RXT15068.1 sporulation integral membrane protein YlbJ [Ammoniphilus sp. CFH 90114]
MRYKSYILTLFYASATLILVFSIVRYPQIAFESSLRGLQIWWDVVFPATLPFMILSELMLGFGVVHFMGILLEPLMRPLFNVPGTGGFVLAMGFSSGYPVGPKLAARLREQQLVSRSEGERLLCFTSTSDPIFIFGAVAVGFFHDAALGISIAIANFAGAIIIGILLRYHDRKGESTPPAREHTSPLIFRALQAMHRARIKDNRPLGKLMGDAVLSSFQTLIIMGGFIIIFSVVIKFVTLGLISEILAYPAALLLALFHLSTEMSQSLIVGFFEVTQSMQYISELTTEVNMQTKIAIAAALVAWGGISVHAQVASIISSTDLRYQPYFIWKALHALASGVLCYLIWTPLQPFTSHLYQSLPAFAKHVPGGGLDYALEAIQHMSQYAIITAFVLGLFALIPLILQKVYTRP